MKMLQATSFMLPVHRFSSLSLSFILLSFISRERKKERGRESRWRRKKEMKLSFHSIHILPLFHVPVASIDEVRIATRKMERESQLVRERERVE